MGALDRCGPDGFAWAFGAWSVAGQPDDVVVGDVATGVADLGDAARYRFECPGQSEGVVEGRVVWSIKLDVLVQEGIEVVDVVARNARRKRDSDSSRAPRAKSSSRPVMTGL